MTSYPSCIKSKPLGSATPSMCMPVVWFLFYLLCVASLEGQQVPEAQWMNIELPAQVKDQGISDFCIHSSGFVYYLSERNLIRYDGNDHIQLKRFAEEADCIACHDRFILVKTKDECTSLHLSTLEVSTIPLFESWDDHQSLGDSLLLKASSGNIWICSEDSTSDLQCTQSLSPKIQNQFTDNRLPLTSIDAQNSKALRLDYLEETPWILREDRISYSTYPITRMKPKSVLLGNGRCYQQADSSSFRIRDSQGSIQLETSTVPYLIQSSGNKLLVAHDSIGVLEIDTLHIKQWLPPTRPRVERITAWQEGYLFSMDTLHIHVQPNGLLDTLLLGNYTDIQSDSLHLCYADSDSLQCENYEGLLVVQSSTSINWELTQDLLWTQEGPRQIRATHITDRTTPFEVSTKDEIIEFHAFPHHLLIQTDTRWLVYSLTSGSLRDLAVPTDFEILQKPQHSTWFMDHNYTRWHLSTFVQSHRPVPPYITETSASITIIQDPENKIYPDADLTTLSLKASSITPFGKKDIKYRWRTNKQNKINWSSSRYFKTSIQNLDRVECQLRSQGVESPWISYQVIHSHTAAPSEHIKYWWILAIFPLMILFMYRSFKNKENQKQQNEEKKQRLTQQIQALQQSVLQSQMNPHFIFNGLESIRQSLGQQTTENTERLLLRFGQLFRTVLELGDREQISLEEELSFLREYVHVESQVQGLKDLEFRITGDILAEAQLVNIPALCLQPFVENALVHGLTTETKSPTILLHLEDKKDFLHCHISDNGIGLSNTSTANTDNPQRNHAGKATQIIRDRLKNYSNQPIRYASSDLEDRKGTKVTIILPIFAPS